MGKKLKRKPLKDSSPQRTVFLPKKGKILEIGPFYNPLCTGNNVKYFDILNQQELQKRAESIGASGSSHRIPKIDFVSKIGDISIITEKFDSVVSSHVIEHQLDFIDHLQGVSKILKERGEYVLRIPDKRFCFDHYLCESTIAEILSAYFEKKSKHSLKSVIEHRALTTHNNPILHWRGEHGERKNIQTKIKSAIEEFKREEYIDVHAWYFTPSSFAEIISTLTQLDYIDFRVKSIDETFMNTLEFSVILEKIPGS